MNRVVVSRRAVALVLAAASACLGVSRAENGRLQLRTEGVSTYIQVFGDKHDDWRIQASGDLATWDTVTSAGTLISGDTNPPSRFVGTLTEQPRFYRALKTAGLYDRTLLRTMSLSFTQANWQTLLANGRTSGSNVLGDLVMDNGATVSGIGARYKGNTSYTRSGAKKSVNIEMDFTNTTSELMSYEIINLNNAYGDETIMREPLYFNVMEQYTVCPKGALTKLYINGEYWGVYALAQQGDGDLVREWFPSNGGDRWRAPNIGGGGFASGASALAWLGSSVSTYKPNYELKTDNSTNAWERLVHVIDVLNNTAAAELRDKVETVLAVDRWLWFLAIENIFADDDSYWRKGADYAFYFEPESGRIHPIEHDGNEAFTAGDVQLSPVHGATISARPVLFRLLPIPELRQRYLAHMRTVLDESYRPDIMTGLINEYSALSIGAITADPKKGYTMTSYANDLLALKTFVTNRYRFLTNHAELRPVPPTIAAVNPPASTTAGAIPVVTAQVLANGTDGIDSVWLYHRGRSYGRFASVQMFDDGAHDDATVGDGIFGAVTAAYPAGAKVRYYVEARAANSAKAAAFAPARAEQETFSYRVALATAPNTRVVINEVMASNTRTVADPQGEFDDWIELHNVSDSDVDLTGCHLSDEPNNPRKWQFPAGTSIPADGYLMVWADEDGKAGSGLHASFKLSATGETLFLTDTDANFNAVLDSVSFGEQTPDSSYGRTAADGDVWAVMDPSPGEANR